MAIKITLLTDPRKNFESIEAGSFFKTVFNVGDEPTLCRRLHGCNSHMGTNTMDMTTGLLCGVSLGSYVIPVNNIQITELPCKQ